MMVPAQRETDLPGSVDSLRERLIAMREALIDGLAAEPVIDGGMLRLLGDVGSALRALDDQPAGGR